MLLVVDAGNTNVKLGLFEGEDLAAAWRLGTDIRRTSDELTAMLVTLMQHQGYTTKGVDSAVISSVVPPLTGVLEEVCRQAFGVTPLTVGHETPTGVRICIDNPREVGTDRIVHTAAAHRLFGGPSIVVDFGTGTVFDVVSVEGDYLGGVIAPGIELAAEALFARAAKLPRIELQFPHTVVGKSTVHAMQSGLMYGYLSLVEGVLARLKKEMGGAPKVIATGGLARIIKDHTAAIDIVEPDLNLKGLRLIYEMNRPPVRG
jgi:type III pantothenate kinase